jgi:hypothetical protein
MASRPKIGPCGVTKIASSVKSAPTAAASPLLNPSSIFLVSCVRALLIMLVIGCLTPANLLITRGSSTPKRGKSTSDNKNPTRSPSGRVNWQCGRFRLDETPLLRLIAVSLTRANHAVPDIQRRRYLMPTSIPLLTWCYAGWNHKRLRKFAFSYLSPHQTWPNRSFPCLPTVRYYALSA